MDTSLGLGPDFGIPIKIKDRLGIRAKGLVIHGSEDEYQRCHGQTGYGY
ncbi:MAG: hypothetical protein QNK40_04735 [Desulfobacterales bacterium]|nr:hypothetical protein [Desulfobacterales bacterium]